MHRRLAFDQMGLACAGLALVGALGTSRSAKDNPV